MGARACRGLLEAIILRRLKLLLRVCWGGRCVARGGELLLGDIHGGVLALGGLALLVLRHTLKWKLGRNAHRGRRVRRPGRGVLGLGLVLLRLRLRLRLPGRRGLLRHIGGSIRIRGKSRTRLGI